jgi:NAD(P)-dependent dehydrogenase (short-subunit alcohol dehydrogenase family)
MERPCFIVVDPEFPGSISTRKLVIETAKFNVITAYDGAEALECLRRFPKVDGVVVNADMADDEECRKLIDDLREIVPKIDVVVISNGGRIRHDRTEHTVDSLNPKELLECLQSLRKDATTEILARESKMTD